ncbi:FAD-dependent oxidoreductase [bacterium]|nr:FAD-dependent oxidoreductase [bacterium]
MRRAFRFIMFIALCSASAAGQTILVEAEGFSGRGGWKLDQQFMDQMGSPYLLAHGLGEPVADAATTVAFPETGTYRIFVRTQDWVAKFGAKGAPGKFQVVVDGKPLKTTFGTEGAAWRWQDGGAVAIAKAQTQVALHDLTGFDGRCDAIVFTTDKTFTPPNDLKGMAAFRKKALGLSDRPQDAGKYDLVIVGGGVPGCTAAISAARLGLSVALVQDRPVLGGNSSSEVRVWISGNSNLGPYPILGEILREFRTRPRVCPDPRVEAYGDDKKLAVVTAEKNIRLFLNHYANQVEMDGKRIVAVVAQHIATGQRVRFEGSLFADCTGHGTIGYLAGADWDMLEDGHMGRSNLWYPQDTGKPQTFPRCAWAADLYGKPFPTQLNRIGKWFWESGFAHNPIEKGEYIRDTNFRAMYGAWDALKNDRKLYPNHKLVWGAYIAGPRESRRLLGDLILTKEHVMDGVAFPDAAVPCTWSIDLHLPEKKYGKGFEGDEFLSYAQFTRFKGPYILPYRTLYSRNIDNLFMAGRNISVTHEALGTVRVMATGGMMGEVVGRAAFLCKQNSTTPRGVYKQYLDALKDLFQKPLSTMPAPAPGSGRSAGGPTKPLPKFEAPGPNVAPKAKVTTSGDYDAKKMPATNITDGKIDWSKNNQRWLSKSGLPHSIEFAWATPQTLATMRVVSGYNHGGAVDAPITDFVLQAHDGSGWKDIPGGKVTGNTKTCLVHSFGPVTTRRLRLHVTAVQTKISRIWEIELYGPKK